MKLPAAEQQGILTNIFSYTRPKGRGILPIEIK